MHERVLVVNGDILTDLDLDALAAFHEEHGGSATIALTPVEDPSSYGVVATDAVGRVLAFVEKPAPGEAPSNLINAGTYLLDPAALAAIPEGRPSSIEREVFPALVAAGDLYAMASRAYWIDTGTPDRYRQAQLDILRGLRPGTTTEETTETAPGVSRGAGATLCGEAGGVVFARRGATVASGARVVDSVIGLGAAIHEGATVTGSILLEGAVVGAGAVVERSILGPRSQIGEGAVLTNDTIIGAGAVVEAGARLDGARHPR